MSGSELVIGITGTREGMSDIQRTKFTSAVVGLIKKFGVENIKFVHGDCLGVDVQAAEIVTELGIYTIARPPIKEEQRAFHKSNEILEQEGYLERDRKIVDTSDVMFVITKNDNLNLKSGTIYTYKYALKKNKPYVLILPNGTGTNATNFWN